MGKKTAKKEAVNIDAAMVKKLFVQLATPEGVILTSTTPQMKDLGPDGYRYTMWGLDKNGKRCLVVMAADRDGISPKENWAAKYPAMKTVTGAVVDHENQKFAAKKILTLCANEGLAVTNRTARPVELPFGAGVHYGYAMCAKQGEKTGFVTIEAGADVVNFTEIVPKFL